jgi:hypothetical protein
VETAAYTLQTLDLRVPLTNFFGRRPRYLEPDTFRENLKASVPAQQLLARRIAAVSERALAKFGPNGMENLYLAEKSPRWKAWYDLTRGRLLAVQVRCMEYDMACGLIAQALQPNTNHLILRPDSHLRHGSNARLLAEESGRLLQRCVKDNHNTPWALLAQRELDYPLGIEGQQGVIPVPPPETGTPKPKRPRNAKIVLPRL